MWGGGTRADQVDDDWIWPDPPKEEQETAPSADDETEGADMAKIESYFNCDLKKAVQVQVLSGNVFSMDNNGNRICVRIFNDGEKATVTGSVSGRCILADGSTVNVSGGLTTANGQSVAYVDIPQGCLLIPGTLKITVQLTDSGVITTLAAILTTVYQTKTDNVITPSQQIINDWNAAISSALGAQDAQISALSTALTAETNARQNADNDLKSAMKYSIRDILTLESGGVKASGNISDSNQASMARVRTTLDTAFNDTVNHTIRISCSDKTAFVASVRYFYKSGGSYANGMDILSSSTESTIDYVLNKDYIYRFLFRKADGSAEVSIDEIYNAFDFHFIDTNVPTIGQIGLNGKPYNLHDKMSDVLYNTITVEDNNYQYSPLFFGYSKQTILPLEMGTLTVNQPISQADAASVIKVRTPQANAIQGVSYQTIRFICRENNLYTLVIFLYNATTGAYVNGLNAINSGSDDYTLVMDASYKYRFLFGSTDSHELTVKEIQGKFIVLSGTDKLGYDYNELLSQHQKNTNYRWEQDYLKNPMSEGYNKFTLLPLEVGGVKVNVPLSESDQFTTIRLRTPISKVIDYPSNNDTVPHLINIVCDDNSSYFMNVTIYYKDGTYANQIALINTQTAQKTYTMNKNYKFRFIFGATDNHELSVNEIYEHFKITLTDDNNYDVFNFNQQAMKRTQQLSVVRSPLFEDTKKQLTLLHFSDVHQLIQAWISVGRWMDRFDDCIDAGLHTGDYVKDFQSQYTDLYNEYMPTAPILNVVGNHDTYLNVGHDLAPKETTRSLIFNHTDNWGAIFRDNSDMYYYKDFTDSDIRLIVLDEYYADATETAWLEDVLEDAKENSLYVITAKHEPLNIIPAANRVSTFNPTDDWSNVPYAELPPPLDIEPYITAFINAGGKYICNLCGHVHRDYFGKTQAGLLNITIECATVNGASWNDSVRKAHTETQDCFNVISFDTIKKHIRIVRVGSNMNYDLSPKNVLVYNFETDTIVKNY